MGRLLQNEQASTTAGIWVERRHESVQPKRSGIERSRGKDTPNGSKEYMTYKHDIKEEEKGAEHYEHLAKKNPKFRGTFKSMAKDEESHEAKLKRIAKSKALKKKG